MSTSSIFRIYFPFVASLLIILPSACSTVVEGSDQPMTLLTNPDGAKCTLSRDGAVISAISSTPGSVVVSKSKDEIVANCTREGYLEALETIESGATGWSAGNIAFGLLGGGIGLIIDSASGAMNKYPETVTIHLAPESFPSIEERDSFFDARLADVEAKFEKARTEVESQCRAQNAELCDSKLAKVDEALDKERAKIESQRQAVTIIPVATTGASASSDFLALQPSSDQEIRSATESSALSSASGPCGGPCDGLWVVEIWADQILENGLEKEIQVVNGSYVLNHEWDTENRFELSGFINEAGVIYGDGALTIKQGSLQNRNLSFSVPYDSDGFQADGDLRGSNAGERFKVTIRRP